MEIRKIPDDTWCFKYYNANPKNKRTGDCVVRAVSLAVGYSWDIVYSKLSTLGRMNAECMESEAVYSEYLGYNGYFLQGAPKIKGTNKRYTGTQFAGILQENNFEGTIVAHIGTHHIVTIKQGVFYDTWDCTDGAVGKVWVYDSDIQRFRSIFDK